MITPDPSYLPMTQPKPTPSAGPNCAVATGSAPMTLMRGTPDEIKRDLAAIDAEISRLRSALREAITDAYDARSMMAAREYVGARSTLWDSCKKMEAALSSPNK